MTNEMGAAVLSYRTTTTQTTALEENDMTTPIILVFYDKTPRCMPLDDSERAPGVMSQTVLGSPWLVLVREPDQLGAERTHPQQSSSLRASSSSRRWT